MSVKVKIKDQHKLMLKSKLKVRDLINVMSVIITNSVGWNSGFGSVKVLLFFSTSGYYFLVGR